MGKDSAVDEMSEHRFLEWIRHKLDRGVPNRDRETREINWQRDSLLLLRLISTPPNDDNRSVLEDDDTESD